MSPRGRGRLSPAAAGWVCGYAGGFRRRVFCMTSPSETRADAPSTKRYGAVFVPPTIRAQGGAWGTRIGRWLDYRVTVAP